jgi:transcriptional regulator with XRE-family HTH domain
VATTLRADYGLSRASFARMIGVSEVALRRWEEGTGQPDGAAVERFERVGRVLGGLARVMRKPFIPTWLEQPNDACKEVGAGTPLDLLERGDFAAVEDMIFYLESGVPD